MKFVIWFLIIPAVFALVLWNQWAKGDKKKEWIVVCLVAMPIAWFISQMM